MKGKSRPKKPPPWGWRGGAGRRSGLIESRSLSLRLRGKVNAFPAAGAEPVFLVLAAKEFDAADSERLPAAVVELLATAVHLSSVEGKLGLGWQLPDALSFSPGG